MSETQFQVLQLLVLYILARAAQLVQFHNFLGDHHKTMQAKNFFSKYKQRQVFIMTCDVHYNPGHGYCLSVIYTYSVMHLQTISLPYNDTDKIDRVVVLLKCSQILNTSLTLVHQAPAEPKISIHPCCCFNIQSSLI